MGLLASVVVLAACGGGSGAATELSSGSPKSNADSIAACLKDAGYKTQAGLVNQPGADAPEAEVGYQRGRDRAAGGEIAVYATEAEAGQKLAGIEQNAKAFDGVVEGHGLASVVFFATPPADVHDDVLGCIATAGSA